MRDMLEPRVQAAPRRLYYKGHNTEAKTKAERAHTRLQAAARGFGRWRERWHMWARESLSRAARSGTDQIGDSDSNGVVGFQKGRLNGR